MTTTTFTDAAVPAPQIWSGMSGAVVARAGIVALILGTVLTIANQSEALVGAEELQLLPLALVFATPFVVVTISQLLGRRQAVIDRQRPENGGADAEHFVATLGRHGIPWRAAVLGLIVGSVNTGIVLAITIAEGGSPAGLPWPLIAQAFSLPVLFGVLSQALAYRRTVRSLARPGRTAVGQLRVSTINPKLERNRS